MLQTTPMPTPFMMPLFPHAIELLDYDEDCLKKLLKIIESYIILDPQSTLQPSYISLLFSKLSTKILSSKATDAPHISHTLDLVLQSMPIQMYGETLIQSGLLTNILNILLQGKV